MAAVLMGLIAFIILPAILIYSLIKPSKLNIRTQKNPNGKWTRGKFLLGWVVVWFISIGIGVSLTPEQEATDLEQIATDAGLSPDEYEMQDNGALKIKAPEEPDASDDVATAQVDDKQNAEVEDVAQTADKTFGITPLEFSRRFSTEAEKVGFGEVPYGDFETTKGAVNDTFSVILSEAIAMNGSVDKNGELKGLTFIMGKTQNGDTEGLNMAMMAGLSARAISPDLPKEESAGTVMKVLAEALEGFQANGEGESSKVVDDVKYTAFASKTVGMWIVLEPA